MAYFFMENEEKQGKSKKIVGLDGQPLEAVESSEITRVADASNTFADSITISQVLGMGGSEFRARYDLYQLYQRMIQDPIINAALNLHVTQSLGGHETTGDVVFIEKKPNITPAEEKIIDELQREISPLVNDVAYQVCFNAVAFGDSYARIYLKNGDIDGIRNKKKTGGVIGFDVSDFYLPQLVLPFEKNGRTIGYEVSVEMMEARTIKLNALQIARMKMPRMSFVPQVRTAYNHMLAKVQEDNANEVPMMAATVGGSFLEAAEKPFFLLQSALAGLNSSRILDSIRESILGLNVQNMTKEQRDAFMNRVSGMLKRGKEKAAKAIKDGNPTAENTYHLLPMFNEKQLYSIDAGGGKNSTTSNPYNVDDVMFYAKMLAGSLGIDLSILGFSELLSGGLGDGGFFRVSAHSGQKARMIRQGFSGFVNDIIDVHMTAKYGGTFKDGSRPYEVVFVGASSALEREAQETRERKMNASAILLQTIQQLKDNGASAEVAEHFLKEQCGLDEDDAKMYAKMISGGNAADADNEDFKG